MARNGKGWQATAGTSSRLVALLAVAFHWLPWVASGCYWFPTNDFFWREYRNALSKETYGSEKKAMATTGNQW